MEIIIPCTKRLEIDLLNRVGENWQLMVSGCLYNLEKKTLCMDGNILLF
jgi:hypothetical protein